MHYTPSSCAELIESVYHLHLDDVYSEFGIVLDGPVRPDRCVIDDEHWAEAMAVYTDQLCAAKRITTRDQLDAWFAGEF